MGNHTQLSPGAETELRPFWLCDKYSIDSAKFPSPLPDLWLYFHFSYAPSGAGWSGLKLVLRRPQTSRHMVEDPVLSGWRCSLSCPNPCQASSAATSELQLGYLGCCSAVGYLPGLFARPWAPSLPVYKQTSNALAEVGKMT